MKFPPEFKDHDKVTFFIRPDFSDLKVTPDSHYIKRGDKLSLRYYIKQYLDTSKKEKRPDTPSKLILQRIPRDFSPKY